MPAAAVEAFRSSFRLILALAALSAAAAGGGAGTLALLAWEALRATTLPPRRPTTG